MSRTTLLLTSILLVVCAGCSSIHVDEYNDSVAEARTYLMKLTGDRFDLVMEDNNLYPLFDPEASYEEASLAARRAVRWRMNLVNNMVESGWVNMAMTFSGLLGRKPRVDADE